MTGARRALAAVGMERRQGEGVGAYLDRVRAYVSGGRVFKDSTELVRQNRIERTNELMRAGGWDDLVDES